jgi:hypothetical protein
LRIGSVIGVPSRVRDWYWFWLFIFHDILLSC